MITRGMRTGGNRLAPGRVSGRMPAQGVPGSHMPKAQTKRTKSKSLVVVESPAKAKTINKYLGDDYVVLASVGHVRDLPRKKPKGDKSPVPAIDLERDFEPRYEVLSDKKGTVSDLRKAAREARQVGIHRQAGNPALQAQSFHLQASVLSAHAAG